MQNKETRENRNVSEEEIKELEKEAREKLADYVSIYFDCMWYQELLNNPQKTKETKQCQ